MPRNVAGAPVRGADFWGRDVEVEAVWDRLEVGSVLLAAPRRHGKSSLMWALKDAPRPGWQVVYLDVEYVQTPSDFLVELMAMVLQLDPVARAFAEVKKLPGRLGAWVRGAFSDLTVKVPDLGEAKLGLRGALVADHEWPELAEELLQVLRGLDGRLLLLIDEFPMMVETFLQRDQDAALRFLRWFRARRAPSEGGVVRFLLGGSVNIEPLLERIGRTKLINDLERYPLLEFSADKRLRFVRAVLDETGFHTEPETAEEIVAVADTGVPFFLQVLISECLGEARRREVQLGPAVVRDAYRERVLGPSSRARFGHYQSRLKNYGALEEPARVVLGELSLRRRTPAELRDALAARGQADVEFEALLSLLESDYYIHRSGSEVWFRSGFLREWWRRNAPAGRRS